MAKLDLEQREKAQRLYQELTEWEGCDLEDFAFRYVAMQAVMDAAIQLDTVIDGVAIHGISTKWNDLAKRVVGAKRVLQDAVSEASA